MAKNCITVPDIKFTYLITFRQLNLLDEEKLSLRELLNLCPLLNEKTMINDPLIEYIIQHPEQLFVVFDGFDEYKHKRKIHGSCERRFPNDAEAQMPVHALVSKLIQNKILAESTIMVTSRPGEAKDLYQNIPFDQYVEITGFSKTQIIEYIEKYFNSRPEEAMTEEEKKKAINKFKGTEHYMAFGRVPLRCFLMCPDRHNRERGDEEACKKSASVDVTLQNLSKLAAQLHQEKRFSFTLEDLDKLELTENELLHIKSSNLLYCCPVVSNKSKYRETHIEYCFAHSTIQEFLVAWHLVSEKKIPTKRSDILFEFMSGLLKKTKKQNTSGFNENDSLMEKLLDFVDEVQGFKDFDLDDFGGRLLPLTCLYEYGRDSELTKRMIITNRYGFWSRENESISIKDVIDTECDAVAMLVDTLDTVSPSVPPPNTLHIYLSRLNCSCVHSLLPSLTKPNCNIPQLVLWNCGLDDKCAGCLGQYLARTKINKLELPWNRITDVGVENLVDQCSSTCINFTQLNMENNEITDSGLMFLINRCPSLTRVDLSLNEITDVGVEYLTNHCPSNLKFLGLSHTKITDSGVKYLADHCPSSLIELDLSTHRITDSGLDYIVKHRPINLRELNLYQCDEYSSISNECKERCSQFCMDNYPDFNLGIYNDFSDENIQEEFEDIC
ncbi:NACHT, LRR and PYD domains-containing protein 3 [Exaiptasia diaphana]|uniref:NACHT domain-containing protein n=1 Tax=Exaiptasia diaphana TaxID=2652724 RepID=A0A913XV05_EXADI|nr:NACHT, LRR and PYD domains-containing protein 3 [Exaiptasia diaphana]